MIFVPMALGGRQINLSKMKRVVVFFCAAFTVVCAHSQKLEVTGKTDTVEQRYKHPHRINRDSALVYMDGRFYSIDDFDKMNFDTKAVYDSGQFIQHPDSIAAFVAKRLKVIIWIKKEEEP